MDTIAARLEFTKPALYRYFKSKEDLFYAVVLRGSTILADMMTDEVNSQATGIGKICATGIAYCKFYREYPDYSRLMLEIKNNPINDMDCLNLQKLSEHNLDHLEIMCNAIEMGKNDGTIRKDIDTMMTALFLVESTIAVMKVSENIKETELELNEEDFIMHSMKLMGNSIESNNGEIT